jgi:predicted transposase/invertase (TIGR01784 family)
MLFDEWKLDEALVVEREEGIEEGIEKGIEKGKLVIARNALLEGLPLEVIRKITGFDTQTIQSLANQ